MKGLARLLQAGVFIGGSITAAIPTPVELKSWPNIIAAVGYAIALATVTPGSKRARTWVVATLIAGALCGLACLWVYPTHTLEIGGNRYIAGELISSVRQEIEKRGISPKEYFQWGGKDPRSEERRV